MVAPCRLMCGLGLVVHVGPLRWCGVDVDVSNVSCGHCGAFLHRYTQSEGAEEEEEGAGEPGQGGHAQFILASGRAFKVIGFLH